MKNGVKRTLYTHRNTVVINLIFGELETRFSR